jgi:hypothetical protein
MRSQSLALVAILLIAAAGDVGAQGRGRAGGPAATARAAAPRDLTGTWVSVVTEQWHLRMLVPPKGEFAMLPINAEARKLAMAFDASKEPAAEQCRPYGAAAIMRVPGRFHIQWADDNTLRMDIDSGAQTRMLRFGASVPPNQPLEWQGYSVANWEPLGARRGAIPTQLHVRTTRLRPGYLRRNGVPYSEGATVDEYFDRFTEPNGDNWLVVTTIVTDPKYLTQPYVTTHHFRKIPDKEGWDPTPCRVDEAR